MTLQSNSENAVSANLLSPTLPCYSFQHVLCPPPLDSVSISLHLLFLESSFLPPKEGQEEEAPFKTVLRRERRKERKNMENTEERRKKRK
ncbi:hypothetical protein TNCT_676761 [Trichonephila clavata]|uniref:Uncharacterized protein n=1 Tax=Trichonephila clavata TaxID=2740835 RepID=A0A8X6LBP9_TRICU|nr:hypothetical protein TNCT_676761 [Trichonephila clavata]